MPNAVFSDASGAVWKVEIDIPVRNRIKKETDFDICKLIDISDQAQHAEIAKQLDFDLCNQILFWALRDQFEKNKLGVDGETSAEQIADMRPADQNEFYANAFFKSLSKFDSDGRSIHSEANAALIEGLNFFFRVIGSPGLAKGFQATANVVRKNRESFEQAIDEIDWEELVQAELTGTGLSSSELQSAD